MNDLTATRTVNGSSAPSATPVQGPRPTTSRSPVPAIAGSIAAGLVLALVLAFVAGPVAGGTEATITGVVLLAFGLGWGLMSSTTTSFSTQPQRWMLVPAAVLGFIGLGLVVLQPGQRAMEVVGWVWPPVIAVLATWITWQARANLQGRGRWLVVPLEHALAEGQREQADEHRVGDEHVA